MIHVHGSMKTEKFIQIVKPRLSKYKLGLNNNIVATITDSTSNIMMKLGKETSPIHNACLAHKIHLCVCDILYKPHKMNNDVIDDVTKRKMIMTKQRINMMYQTAR